MSSHTKIVINLLLFCALGLGNCLSNDESSKLVAPDGAGVISVKTTQLLKLLCKEAHDGNPMAHDACVGCFYKASTKTGYPTLYEMASCADVYLNNTDYAPCRRHLPNITISVDERVGPTLIHCSFLQCVRKVNKASLESLKSIVNVASVSKKSALLVSVKNYLIGIQGLCLVRKSDTKPISNAIRQFAEPRIPRRNYNIGPIVRNAGPDNVFQFFINGRSARQARQVGQYNRRFSGQNMMRRYESNYRRFQENNRLVK